MRRPQVAALLDAVDHGQQIRCREFRDRPRADVGEDIPHKLALEPPGVTRGPVGRVSGQPFGGYRLEAVPGPLPLRPLLGLAVGARVDVTGQKLAGLVPPPPGELQRDLGIDAHGDPLLLLGEAVLEAPSLGAARGDFEVQAPAVVDLAGLVAGLGLPDGGVGQRHVGASVDDNRDMPRNNAP